MTSNPFNAPSTEWQQFSSHPGPQGQSGQIPLPAPSFAPAAAPRPAGNSALVMSIIALVTSVLALLGTIFLFFAMPVDESEGPAVVAYDLQGTLPQAVTGEAYSAERVTEAVKRLLDRDRSTYSNLTCGAIEEVKAGATTTCRGTVDYTDTDITVTLDDATGNFTMTQRF